jgi:hypothetical protein
MIQWWIILVLLSPSGEVVGTPYKKQMDTEVACFEAETQTELPNGNWFVVKCGMVMEN